MTLIPPKEVRPPLPRGPFLVVGLARSGQAAARLLAARGEVVRAVDSAHPEGAEGLAEQMRAAGFAGVEFDRLTFGAVALHLGKK